MSKLKSWIILRGGIKRIENGTARPPDAVIEYTNQIPVEDVAYAVVTDDVDKFGNDIKVVSVNAPAKAAGDADKATKKAANEAKVVKRKKDKDDLDLAFSDVDNIKNVPQIIEYLKLLTKHIVG